jgi:hypothetical protein
LSAGRYFIIHLREKDPSEYTGAEQYICEKLAADDVAMRCCDRVNRDCDRSNRHIDSSHP